MVDKELFAVFITGEASDLVVYRYNIGVETADKIVE